MSQVTIYLDDDAVARARASAAAAQMSLSAWIGKLVKAQAPPVDAHGYPVGFFEDMAAGASTWQSFPEAQALRTPVGQDLPRERW